MPAMRSEAQAPRKPPDLRRGADRRARRLRPGQRRRPRRAARRQRQIAQESLHRRRRRPRRRPVPAELRVLPQLHRQGRRAVVGQVRARPGAGQPAQIFTAMLTGPQNMPKFSDRQLSPTRSTTSSPTCRRHRSAGAPAATASAASARRPRAWRSGSSGWSPSSARRCGSEHGHERRRETLQGRRTPLARTAFRAAHRRRTRSDVARGTVALGGKLDGVEIVFKEHRWPVEGTKAEKRAERVGLALWLLLGGSRASRCCWSSSSGRGSTSRSAPRATSSYTLATPLYGLTVRPVDPGDRHRRGAVPEEVHPRRDLDPGPPRRRLPELAAQDRRGQPDRRARGLDHQAPQADRAVARHRPRRVRPRHPGRVRRRPDQEPVEAGGADRRRQEGRAVDVGLDPALPRRDHLPGPRHRRRRRRRRSSRCAPRTSTPAAWRRCSRGGSPTATAPPSNRTRS